MKNKELIKDFHIASLLKNQEISEYNEELKEIEEDGKQENVE